MPVIEKDGSAVSSSADQLGPVRIGMGGDDGITHRFVRRIHEEFTVD